MLEYLQEVIHMNIFNEKINQLINNKHEQINILVYDIKNQQILYENHAQQKLISASTIKTPILLAILNEIKNQHCSLNDKIQVSSEDICKDSDVFEWKAKAYSLYELLTWMIINSDNTATNVLIRHFTKETINQYIQEELKMTSTSLQRKMLDYEAIQQGYNNYTSQKDQCKMFLKLMNHEILNDELCQIAFDILLSQRCQNQIMRYLYEPVLYAHKTGELDYLHHDCGVMKVNEQWYYVGVSIKSENIEGNYPLMGQLGRVIYETLKERI